MFTVYIIESITTGRYYYGHTPSLALMFSRWREFVTRAQGTGRTQNRLYELDDAGNDSFVTPANEGVTDLPNSSSTFNPLDPAVNSNYNYGYDAIGNLQRDTREAIAQITWTASGKVDRVLRTPGQGSLTLDMGYDATGQRTSKLTQDDQNAVQVGEYYLRDAQGNIMAIYRFDLTQNPATFRVGDRAIYGSSRVGVEADPVPLSLAFGDYPATAPNTLQHPAAAKLYELTVHLGNVHVTVRNHHVPNDGSVSDDEAEWFEPVVASAQDYYPFGSLLPGRNYSSGSYRYLFQGQEHDDEINGAPGTSYAFEYRIHDPRIGRFLSIDPLAAKYAYNSPYAFSENRVIDGVELEGLEVENFMTAGKTPGELALKLPDLFSDENQHYSVTVKDPNVTFSQFKQDFSQHPERFLSGSNGIFTNPRDADGKPTEFSEGSYLGINTAIFVPFYVKVLGVMEDENTLYTSFATMEGHPERGLINFTLADNEDGSFSFTIHSVSRPDWALLPSGLARSKQAETWNEVMTGVVNYLGGEEVEGSRESYAMDPKTQERVERPVAVQDKQ